MQILKNQICHLCFSLSLGVGPISIAVSIWILKQCWYELNPGIGIGVGISMRSIIGMVLRPGLYNTHG